jgi:hypothetical protein
MITRQVHTFEEFQHFAALPENEDRLFEFIKGEIIEVTPSRTWYSGISVTISAAVVQFCKEKGIPRYTSGEQGAYSILGHSGTASLRTFCLKLPSSVLSVTTLTSQPNKSDKSCHKPMTSHIDVPG